MSNGIEEKAEAAIKKWYLTLWDEDATVVKNLLRLGGWIVAIFQTGLLAYFMYAKFTLDETEWSLYFNSKGPQAWVNLVLVALVYLLVELITKGNTTRNITNINENSSWQEKAIACAFMLGIAYVAAIAVTART